MESMQVMAEAMRGLLRDAPTWRQAGVRAAIVPGARR